MSMYVLFLGKKAICEEEGLSCKNIKELE